MSEAGYSNLYYSIQVLLGDDWSWPVSVADTVIELNADGTLGVAPRGGD